MLAPFAEALVANLWRSKLIPADIARPSTGPMPSNLRLLSGQRHSCACMSKMVG